MREWLQKIYCLFFIILFLCIFSFCLVFVFLFDEALFLLRCLTHFMLLVFFYTHLKTSEIWRFSDVFWVIKCDIKWINWLRVQLYLKVCNHIYVLTWYIYIIYYLICQFWQVFGGNSSVTNWVTYSSYARLSFVKKIDVISFVFNFSLEIWESW